MTNVKFFFPALGWALFIIVLSTVGAVRAPNLLPHLLAPDKLGHAAAYFIQSALLVWGFHKIGSAKKQALFISLSLSAALGILLEIIQFLFFPLRFFEGWDMVANVMGASIGSSIAALFLYRRK